MGLYDVIDDLLKQLPVPVIVVFLAAILFTDKNGFIQRWHRTRSDDRNQLSADQRDLLDRLVADADRERNWRLDDAEKYRKQIAERDETIRLLTETTYLSERGNSRLRHGLGNMLMYVSALQGQIRRSGSSPYPFTAWQDLLNVSKDLDQSLHDVFDNIPTADKPALPTISQETKE